MIGSQNANLISLLQRWSLRAFIMKPSLYTYTLFGFDIFISNPRQAKKFSQPLELVHKTDKSDQHIPYAYR